MTNKSGTGAFQWIEDISLFTEDYIKNYSENSDTGYLLVVDVTYPKELHETHKYLPFYLKKLKSIKLLSYLVILMINTIILYKFAH